jgi:hypothetical protein
LDRTWRLFGSLLLGPPGEEIAGVEGDAEEVGGDEAELRGADADNTDDSAIDGGYDPALPKLLAEENGAEDGQDAGKIIQSDGMEKLEHRFLCGNRSKWR